jgi:hypothetical protein
MPSKMHTDDPFKIWQNQPTEAFKMSAEDLRHRAHQRQTKAYWTFIFTIAIGVGLSAFFAWSFLRASNGVPRIGLGILTAWGLYSAWLAVRWLRPDRLRPDPTIEDSLKFYRKELQRQLDYNVHVWRRTGLPLCMLGLGLIVLPELLKALAAPKLLMNVAPVLVLLAVWLAIFFPTWKKKRRKLQQEINELREFENTNRA